MLRQANRANRNQAHLGTRPLRGQGTVPLPPSNRQGFGRRADASGTIARQSGYRRPTGTVTGRQTDQRRATFQWHGACDNGIQSMQRHFLGTVCNGRGTGGIASTIGGQEDKPSGAQCGPTKAVRPRDYGAFASNGTNFAERNGQQGRLAT